jgi:hypothetical protein
MGSSGVKQNALANAGTGQQMSSDLYGQANQTYGTLAPQLQSEITNPQGYTPAQKAAQNTAAQQSTGGSMSGAVGQGALQSARTRNAGGSQAAIAQSARTAGQNLSNAALQTETNDANLQQANRQAGLSGMQQLYGTTLGGSENALGLSNQALGVANQAAKPWWQQLAGTVAGNVTGSVGGGNPASLGLG